MMRTPQFHMHAYAICLGVLVAAAFVCNPAARAQAADKDGIGYMTGGVGADAMSRLRARERDFNVKFVFTLVEGNYVSDVAVVVKSKARNPILVVESPGPLMLVKLPKGQYTVDATYEGVTRTRKLQAGDRLRTEYMRWPTNPETDFPGPRKDER